MWVSSVWVQVSSAAPLPLPVPGSAMLVPDAPAHGGASVEPTSAERGAAGRLWSLGRRLGSSAKTVPQKIEKAFSARVAHLLADSRPKSSAAPPADTGTSEQESLQPLAPKKRAVDHRAWLFGSRLGPPSRAADHGRSNAVVYAAHERAILEAQNDKQVVELEKKVSTLKEISLDVAKETQTSIAIVNSVSLEIEKTSGSIHGTMARLRRVSENPGALRSFVAAVLGFVLLVLSLYLLAAVLPRLGHASAPIKPSHAADFLASAVTASPPAA